MFDDRPIAYGESQREAIKTAWNACVAAQPALFNGQVLLMTEGRRVGEMFRGRYSATDYATFLHFMRHGEADGQTRNGFALAGLVSSDGALLMGVMGQHTVNAGRIYFPGGTPDMSDVVGDRVDLEGSVRRELEEETGLTLGEVAFDDGFLLREDDKRCAFVKIVRLAMPADAARTLIMERISRQQQPELADIHIVRGAADPLADRMPPFQSAFTNWWFAERG
ncbi:NUDIX hydrolase [Phreatobacter aquaticus]|uniref:NUDIX hydrolase n=1 Tax=Phreatobacter aquaticus TaxID=2570229 RepID=A0A4D7QJR4_9HYPH|nr:NUDIX hydrolase [Phreatobacter aquaticus]QCK86203.1 NUDIX hydrolase [Phreatobacter aquaticus]